MKYSPSIYFLIALFTFLISCGGDSSDDPVTVIPTNLEVSIVVSETGNGLVNVTATAVNARSYEFFFGDGSESELNTTGTASYLYGESGTYELEVRAYANGTEFINEINEIDVTVTVDISSPPTTGYSTPESYGGYTLIWQDEFEGSSLNTNNWSHEIGTGSNGWGNNELQYYRSQNTSVADGVLTIEARKESLSGSNYTSSRIITKDKLEFTYGRVDIRAALPFGNGLWPALWMLGADIDTNTWPRCGEIDIMELRGEEPDRVLGTVHYGPDFENRVVIGNDSDPFTLPSGTFADEWHVFSLVWDENSITWYVDDQQHFSLAIDSERATYFRKDFFLIFNVAVGGNFVVSPDASTVFPQRMFVDYVRVFQNE